MFISLTQNRGEFNARNDWKFAVDAPWSMWTQGRLEIDDKQAWDATTLFGLSRLPPADRLFRVYVVGARAALAQSDSLAESSRTMLFVAIARPGQSRAI